MIFEVTLESEYYGQQFINRWNYESNSVPAGVTLSFGLASAMGFVIAPGGTAPPVGSIMEAIRGMSSADVRFVQASVRAVYDDIDFFSTPFVPAVLGAVVVSGDAPFVAYGLRTNRVRQDIRRGTKRFGGVPESFSVAAGALNQDGINFLTDLAQRMSQNISYNDSGTTLTYAPIVVKKEKYTTPSGKPAYRYFETLGLQLPNIARSIIWEPYTTLRSQNSRQYDKGR